MAVLVLERVKEIPFLVGTALLVLLPFCTPSYLEQNVRANAMERLVRLAPVAIGPVRGPARMALTLDSGSAEVEIPGQQGFALRFPKTETVPTSMVPLKELVEDHHIPFDEIGLVYCDAQGSETSVIETGAPLWAARVPLWLEVWPEGLAAHGGVEAFLAAARTHFTHFIPKVAFRNDTSITPSPLTDLPALFACLSAPATDTDILLMRS
jgi:hypothetical protein